MFGGMTMNKELTLGRKSVERPLLTSAIKLFAAHIFCLLLSLQIFGQTPAQNGNLEPVFNSGHEHFFDNVFFSSDGKRLIS